MSFKDTEIPAKKSMNIGGRLVSLDHPLVMGVLNVNAESFFQPSRHMAVRDLLEATGKMLADGAAIIDIGAASTRPGARIVPSGEEQERLIPAVRAIVQEFPAAILSVDTYHAESARAAIGEGAHIINDISGGTYDPAMFRVAGELKCPYILMHMRGTPETMREQTHYDNLMGELIYYFSQKLQQLYLAGVHDVLLDPGFGFAKTTEQNYQLLAQLKDLKILKHPMVVGFSRKSMVNRVIHTSPDAALNGTTVLNTLALERGATILRVHDVKEAVQAVKLFCKLKEHETKSPIIP